jgi:hypothetical protein
VEVLAADSAWYPVTGVDIPATSADNVRLSNGVIRIQTLNGTLRHSLWDGTTWDTVDFDFEVNVSPGVWYALGGFSRPTVIRNRYDVAVVRYSVRATSDADFLALGPSFDMTVTVAAGELWAGISLPGSLGAGVPEVRLGVVTPTATTSLTNGIRATSNATNGNRFVIANLAGAAEDLTNGTLEETCLSPGSEWMVAQYLGGSSASGRNTELAIIDDWRHPITATTRVIAR